MGLLRTTSAQGLVSFRDNLLCLKGDRSAYTLPACALLVTRRRKIGDAGYLLMEKVPSFTDADVQKLTDPLMPLVERSKGLQVLTHCFHFAQQCI